MDEIKFKIYYELGENYLKLGKLKEAKTNFEKALNENPDSELPYIGLAKVELKNRNIKKGEELIEKALNISPDNINAKVVLAEIKLLQEIFEESYKLALDCLNKENENIEALIVLQKASFKLGRYDDLEKFLELFHSRIPSDKNILYALAGCLYLQDNLEKAKEYTDKLLVIDKEHTRGKELKDIIEKKIMAIKEVENGNN